MRRKLAILGVILITSVIVRLVLIHPLWMSEPALHSWILARTPIGSSISEVEAFITKRGWNENYHWQGIPSENSERQFPGVRGGNILGADLGGYQGLPWRIDVDAFWGFDESGKLVDLNVRKMADSL